jgi:hypothetical protein
MDDRLIPAIADSLKDFREARLLRCTYYYVAIDETELVWIAGTDGVKGTTFMIGGSPVLSVKASEAELLSSEEEIQGLFASIEDHDHQTVETAPLWVPYDLLAAAAGRQIRRGDVLRLTVPLFHSAYLFGQGSMSQEDMEAVWKEQGEALQQIVREQEREAFGRWMKLQITQSKQRHDEQDAANVLRRKTEK